MMSTSGDDEVVAMIRQLLELNDRRVGTPAVRAGLNVIAGAYREQAGESARTKRNRKRKRKGQVSIQSQNRKVTLKKSVGTRITRKESRNHQVGGKAGFNVSKKNRSRRAPHAHLVTLGTVMRFHRSGHPTGRVSPNGRFGIAARATFPRAVAAMRETAHRKIREIAGS